MIGPYITEKRLSVEAQGIRMGVSRSDRNNKDGVMVDSIEDTPLFLNMENIQSDPERGSDVPSGRA